MLKRFFTFHSTSALISLYTPDCPFVCPSRCVISIKQTHDHVGFTKR